MKLKSVLFALVMPAMLFFTQGCNTCDVSGTITIDAANQFLSITYLVDSSGANYAQSVWNPSNVSILFSEDPVNTGQFVSLSEDLSDGVVGPFAWSTSPKTATKGEYYHYMYIVRKDTFGVDTFEVKFYPAVDECHEFWGLIEYYMNGDIQPGFTASETCALEIRE